MTKELSDQKQRDAIINDLESNILVEAGAGSGKTTSLVSRFTALVKSGLHSPGSIATITFTRKAAAELKERIQTKLEDELKSNLDAIERDRVNEALNNLNQYYIGTIHSFAASLLRERPVETGLDPDFNEISEREEDHFLDRAYNRYLNKLRLNNPEAIEEPESTGVSPDELRDTFKTLSEYPDVEIAVSDKTKPDIEETYNRVIDFANRAINYIPDQEPDKGYDGTQRAVRKAYYQYKYANIEDDLAKLDIIELFNKSVSITLYKWTKNDVAKRYRDETLPGIKANYIDPFIEQWYKYRHRKIVEFLEPALSFYRQERLNHAKLTFQDLLYTTAKTLKNNPSFRQDFQQKYTALMVDEFQDTDPLQAEIIFYLTGKNTGEENWRQLKPIPGSLFVVGDPKQSIFRFRRADIAIYNQVKKQIENTGGRVLYLNSNFRTIPGLTNYLNGKIENIFTENDNGNTEIYAPLDPVRDRAEKEYEGIKKINIGSEYSKKKEMFAEDAKKIARFIASSVENGLEITVPENETNQATTRKVTYDDFMIILRKKKAIGQYIKELKEYNIPVDVTGGSTFDRSAEELRDLHKLLKLIDKPEEDSYLVAVLKGLYFGFSDEDLYEHRINGNNFRLLEQDPETINNDRLAEAIEQLKEYHDWKFKYSPAAFLNKLVVDLGLIPYTLNLDLAENRASNIFYLLEYIREAEVNDYLSFSDMTDRLGEIFADGIEEELNLNPSSSAVRLMNLHRAKGLESPVVILAGPFDRSNHSPDRHIIRGEYTNTGFFCFKKDIGQYYSKSIAYPPDWGYYENIEIKEEAAEEERLIYVAATRAKNLLVISSSECIRKSDFTKDPYNPWRRLLQEGVPSLEIPETYSTKKSANKTKVEIKEFEKFIEKEKDFSDRLKEPTYSLKSATDFDKRDLYKYLKGDDEGSMDYGTAAHRLIEKIINDYGKDDPDRINNFIKMLVEKNELKDTALEALEQITSDFLKSDLYEKLGKSVRIETEVPFYYQKDSNEYVSGIIDLVFLDDDSWKIIDFKTGRPKDKEDEIGKTRAYKPQLDIYHEAWTEITGSEPAATELHWLD
ncbi:UvrD-helicase domain-containing protein [Halanaerobiaceae bacterium Z-7014]|uniref:DNA 3'-5' helicase n=1 Tax=Halonatronomonas betaini TaxID=2778430 RepID=A0A931AT11_9FIRM|nr:UvrD-helicase domain-containing protein [Halonatronomonas betaini]MBF8436089.1 UvrD-helicase domain-containing protein [Halonatronomonas betaini]